MIIAIPCESYPYERRVAVVPALVPNLLKGGHEVCVEKNAGQKAGFPDAAYQQQGAQIVTEREKLFRAEVLLTVHGPADGSGEHDSELELIHPGQIVVGLLNPLGAPDRIGKLASREAICFALELLPRISRAQPMDALSSMATIAGYKSVLIAAGALNKIFPMMITAAGTITPARVLVVGAGVAGLQAIATARRLGAVVSAYDVRPAVKEQVESLGAKFIELDLDTEQSEGSSGYAKAMDEQFYQRQRQMMQQVVSQSDIVITTAAIPGKKAPVLVTAQMVQAMAPGSVIIDLAAETGGNCELTQPGQTVDSGGVLIDGPINLPASIPFHGSQMYAKNVTSFLDNLVSDGKLQLNLEDPIIQDTLVTHNGTVVNEKVNQLLGRSAAPAD